jgi:hypothetical protein
LEQSKKAEKEYKRANSKIPLYRKSVAAGDVTDAEATNAPGQQEAADTELEAVVEEGK